MKNRVKPFLNKYILKHLRNESGSVLVIFAAFMVVAIGFSALVIDLGALRLDKSRLVNAVDAAALAGAYELPSTNQAEQVAREYAAHNEVDSSDVIVSFGNSNSTITVKATRERSFVFGQILGINTGRVQAEATAAAGNVGSMTGVIPVGLQESVYLAMGAGDGFSMVSKDKFAELGPGNWGFVYLDGSASTTEQLTYFSEGFPGVVFIGKNISTDTGSNIQAQKEFRDQLNEYIASGETLYIPIIDDEDMGSGSVKTTVTGFAAIVITGYQGNGPNMKIEAILNPTGEELVQGGIDPNAGYYGLKSIALVN